MALIDYYNIQAQLKSILEADATLTGTVVYVEEETNNTDSPFIGIYLDRREAIDEDQQLASGQKVRYRIHFTIVCRAYSFFDLQGAMEGRDDLLGKVEIALMKNRKISDTVNYSWLDGGEMTSGKSPEGSGYASEGIILLVTEVSASTV